MTNNNLTGKESSIKHEALYDDDAPASKGMTRGGHREGAGRKSTWIRGKTTVVRVPEVLVDEIIRVARLLDEGKSVDDVTKSKYLNVSGISIRLVDGKPAILLEDLLKADFKIRPIEVVDRVRKSMDRRS